MYVYVFACVYRAADVRRASLIDDLQYRIKKSGIKNAIYVVERLHVPHAHYRKKQQKMSSLEKFGKGRFLSALVHSQVYDGFFIKMTDSFEDTLSYVIMLTKSLTRMYKAGISVNINDLDSARHTL